MSITSVNVEELISMIERGELRLPEMQRRYVWRSTRVRDLLDSLYRDYPSGTILVWETSEKVEEQDMAISRRSNASSRTYLLLDGQQRLTSLAALIRGEPINVRGRNRPIELLFNLEHPDTLAVITEVNEESDDGGETTDDETESTEGDLQKRFNKMAFVVSTQQLARLPHWIKVTDVFKTESDFELLRETGFTLENTAPEQYERYAKRLAQLRNIRNYPYQMRILERKLSYEEVTEIFVRVNSLGVKLRSADLALAQITAKWRGSLKIFQDFQEKCGEGGFNLDLSLYLKNLVAFATGQSKFHTAGNLNLDSLKKGWEESCRGMEFALNFLVSNVKIDSPALLSSPFLLITLAYYYYAHKYKLNANEEQQLRYWTLIANAKARYSRGSTESLLDQDLAILRKGQGAEELAERLRQQVGRFDIEPADLKGLKPNSALFKTMFLAFRAMDAKDWRSQVAISLNHSGIQHKLQFHHIFPKAILKGNYTTQEINDIANLAFIAGETNRRISQKAPREYFPDIIKNVGSDAFKAQCIPTNDNLLDIQNYKEFLEERRRQIAERLNQFFEENK